MILNKIYIEDIFPFLIAGIFALLGITFIIISIFITRAKKKRCTEIVYGTCVGLDSYTSYSDGHHRTMYCPIYEIYYRGQIYRLMNNSHSSIRRVNPGDRVELLINPYQPNDFIDPKRKFGVHTVLIFLGVLFTALGIIFVMAFSSAM